ncbi:MAG TPA: phosphate ABC transporter permease subunit PstC [Anaerolineae bacterium]|nr:phosphate ABC transporter permease subunit PstC [Anaerolineae bacterium]
MPSIMTMHNGSGANAIPDLRKRRRWGESVIHALLFLFAALSILTTAGIVVVLFTQALHFFARPEVRLWTFLTDSTWQPQIDRFGILVLVIATFITSLIAMLVAFPPGMMIAIYLSEYASPRTRRTLKPVLEVLAGIPTVVYGYFALTFMTPLLQRLVGKDVVEIFNVASAGIVIGILILPLVTSMAEDALSAVPDLLREAAFGLGATRLETALKVVTPAAMSGLVAAFIVAASRAIGETMIVAIAAGAGPRNFESWEDALHNLAIFNPFKAAETMTGHIVRISGGDISYESIDYDSLFAIGLSLFLITFALNLISRRLVKRFREVY